MVENLQTQKKSIRNHLVIKKPRKLEKAMPENVDITAFVF